MNRPPIWTFAVPLMVVLIFGLTTIWSTVPSLFTSQIIFLLIGIFAFIVSTQLDGRLLKSLATPAYFLCLLLLILTYAIGSVSRGSLRWIDLGPFRFQTSEFSKPLLILAFAHIFGDSPAQNLTQFLRHLVLIAIPALLVLFQPDLGSALVIGLVGFALLIHSGAPLRYPLTLFATGLLLSPLILGVLHDYQRQRLVSFLDPYADPARSGYNVIQATVAIGSGQFLGKGVRQGTQSHLRFLPERHTDFAFASFSEEFGFIGVLILLGCFFFLLNWLLKLTHSSDTFPGLIAAGVFWLILIQTVVNIGMNLGLMPVTGITLPFISYGGSSLISLFLALGLVFASSFR